MEAIVQLSRTEVERFLLTDCGPEGWQWVRSDKKAILSLGGCGSSRPTAFEAQEAVKAMYQKRVKLF